MNATVSQTSTHLNLSSKPLPLTPLQHHPQPPHHHQHGHTHTTTKPSLRDRLAIIRHIPVPIYNHLVAFTSEFLGTTFYLFFALAGAQVAATTAFIPFTNISGISPPSTPPPAALLYTALSFGFSLAVTAWVFFRVTSGLFSPSVTLGMVLLGTLKWGRGVVVFVSQILGGVVAAALVEAVFPGNIGAVGTVLGSGTSLVRGFFIEVLLTAAFVFSVFMLAADKHKGTFIAPIGIGLALFIAELVGAPYTGCSLNPARSFGPAVVTHHFPAYHWIYWTGPLVGSFFAAGFYHAVKALEVETSVAMHGESVLGHRRGVSNSSTVPAAHHMVPRDAHSGHQLGPVHENDLEKGIEHPHQVSATGSESPASPGKCAGQLHYLSGLTAVGDTSVGDADVTKEARSPRPSTHRER